MNTEHPVRAAIGFFLIILGGALLSALIGGLFGALIAKLSPEFVDGLFSPKDGANLTRYSAVVGAIWGLFIGAAVSGFACFLAAVIRIIRLRIEHRSPPRA